MGAIASYVPTWSGEVEGYARNCAMRNLWRVTPDLEFEDLVQEGFVFFLICKTRYKTVNARHFMALFKVCFHHRITALANKRTRNKHVVAISRQQNETELADLAGYNDGGINAVDMMLLLADAPDPLVNLVQTCIDKKQGRRRTRNSVKESTNAWLSRVAGLDDTQDVVLELDNLLTGNRMHMRI